MSRTSNSLRNIAYGFLTQFLTFILSFILRTVFIDYLGSDLLGVNGLYSNILTILSLAELGFATVMIYSLYKPLAENNYEKIAALVSYFRSVYNKVAIVILVLGLLVVPFLGFFIRSTLPLSSLRIYYVLFLLNTVFSYVCIYKTTLINADQKQYLIKNWTLLFSIIKTVCQIAIIYFTGNYYIYLITEVIITLSTNLFLGRICDKYYPYINQHRSQLDKEERVVIMNNVKSMALYKFGVVAMNNTDNLLISKIVGTIWVGFYSNYTLFISAINTLINTFITAMFASLGNLNATADKQRQYEIFNLLLLICHWISAFFSIMFIVLLNDVITVWRGTEFLFDIKTVIVIVLNFYLSNIINPVWMYRETSGLFHKIKYVMLVSSIINIILSIILGLRYGIFGILLSTAISRLLTTVWYEPLVLYKSRFNRSPMEYYLKQVKFICITLLAFLACSFSICWIKDISLVNIIIKCFICGIVSNLIFFIMVYKSKEFNILKETYLKKIVKKGI